MKCLHFMPLLSCDDFGDRKHEHSEWIEQVYGNRMERWKMCLQSVRIFFPLCFLFSLLSLCRLDFFSLIFFTQAQLSFEVTMTTLTRCIDFISFYLQNHNSKNVGELWTYLDTNMHLVEFIESFLKLLWATCNMQMQSLASELDTRKICADRNLHQITNMKSQFARRESSHTGGILNFQIDAALRMFLIHLLSWFLLRKTKQIRHILPTDVGKI